MTADESSSYVLAPFTISSEKIANQTPVVSFSMPVSGLRFEPKVDVQERNLAEGQADVAIRGGIFENTGFKIGALSLYDPQTGHYFAEIPVAPAMLLPPRVLTGVANAMTGFNASVGTIEYQWRPIESRGEASVAFGSYQSNRQSIYQGMVLPGKTKTTVAADVELSRSESDGSVPFGDHRFKRAAGRIQLRGSQSQTDIFAGVQQKFFGWPNLYTPFGFNESEELRTELYAVNHRVQLSPETFWQIGAYHRRNHDDYEFDRATPGASNPFLHDTQVTGVALEGRHEFSDQAWWYSAQAMWDGLDSTSLTSGRFYSRSYLKLALMPERVFATEGGKLTMRGGATYDVSNRDDGALLPLLEAAWENPAGQRVYFQYAHTTQVPTYTALNSSATSGLFRGNRDLDREISRNLELGVSAQLAAWKMEAATFYRWDDELTDWTYRDGVVARTANSVDIGTLGFEIGARFERPRFDLVFGYTYLHKGADYGAALIDASFYALNFARHRVTLAAVIRLGMGFELRLDNEFRVQEENRLRTIGGDESLLSSFGFYYLPPRWRGLEFSIMVDNGWDSDFQDVPAVPAARRQFSIGVTRRW